MIFLFPHLKGYKVLHGSPNYEIAEIIQTIQTEGVGKNLPLRIQFRSGYFTYIEKEDFDFFLANGSVVFKRAKGFIALETFIALESLKDASEVR